jgi:hypothetical protein
MIMEKRFQNFIDTAWSTIKASLEQNGEVSLLCVLGCGNEIAFVPAVIDKEDYIKALPEIAEKFNAEIAVMMSEAWMTTPKKGEPFVRPSQSPNRVEVVLVNWKIRDGEEGGEVRLLVRDKDGKPSIGNILEREPGQPAVMHSRFLENVFGKTTLH